MIIILSIITCISIIISIISILTKRKVDAETQEINKKLSEENEALILEKTSLEADTFHLKEVYNEIDNIILDKTYQKRNLEENISEKKNQLKDIQENIENTLENQKNLSNQAFQNWWDLLEKNYKEKEEEYNNLLENLKSAYSEEQLNLLAEADKIRQDLDKICATRDAAIEAKRKEKEISEKLSFYCLNTNPNELDDIKRLERVKVDLHEPRILSMLIWKTYWQKPMTELCNNVLGLASVTGIYKITNQLSGECYIGQALSCSDRWKQHAKCGCGIDTPAGNKLYKAMQEDGIWNFSWELLEKCSREELDEKEKFYINLYKSYDYGYNSNRGNH